MISGKGVVNATWRPSLDKTPQDIYANVQTVVPIFPVTMDTQGYVIICLYKGVCVCVCAYYILLIGK